MQLNKTQDEDVVVYWFFSSLLPSFCVIACAFSFLQLIKEGGRFIIKLRTAENRHDVSCLTDCC